MTIDPTEETTSDTREVTAPESHPVGANPTAADEGPSADVDSPGDDGPADEVENPVAAAKGRENSKLRERLRDTTAKLEVLQRAEAERLAGQRLGKGADLWAGGIELESLLDDDGNLSAIQVDAAVANVLARHPHWRTPSAPPASVVTANGKIGGGDTRTTFTDAFRPRNE